MKTKILLILLYLATLAGYVVAQTPGFNYQAVLRNPGGETMTNAEVTLHFSLLNGPTESVIYKESQTLTTDELGILTCMIGAGTIESGTFSEITGVQDVTLKIEAELPGETGMTNVGESKLGIIPYALYGKDEDADPDNEMQTLSVQGDSVKISGRGGVEINQLNYWQKTDSSFFLSLDGLVNSRSEDGSQVEIVNSTIKIRDDSGNSKKVSPLGTETKKENQVIAMNTFFMNAAEELSPDTRAELLEEFPEADLARFLGKHTSDQAGKETSLFDPATREWIHRGTLFNSFYGGDLTERGCNVFAGADNNQFTNLFTDNDLGGVGADLFKLGFDEFGFGFGVFCFEDDVTSPRSQAATFGGTMSTANDNGLTTLLGAIPGQDPTNGFNIIFNGQNLGTVSTINSQSAGTSSTYGANGQLNTSSSTFAGDNNGGAHITFDANGALGAYMWTKSDGSSQMVADQFIMSTAAPGRANESANYAAPVGGEAATYDRGTAQLVNGEATIVCPESFRWIADDQSMTVTITPLSAESEGIAVIEKSAGGFKVKELRGGTGNYAFDYLVMCKRKGQENFQVVQPKPTLMVDHSREMQHKLPAGPLKSIRDLYRKYPNSKN